jgi:hypothetical protein
MTYQTSRASVAECRRRRSAAARVITSAKSSPNSWKRTGSLAGGDVVAVDRGGAGPGSGLPVQQRPQPRQRCGSSSSTRGAWSCRGELPPSI